MAVQLSYLEPWDVRINPKLTQGKERKKILLMIWMFRSPKKTSEKGTEDNIFI